MKKIVIGLLLLFFLIGSIASSTHYSITKIVVGSGTIDANSETFETKATVGEISGDVNSETYYSTVGFQDKFVEEAEDEEEPTSGGGGIPTIDELPDLIEVIKKVVGEINFVFILLLICFCCWLYYEKKRKK